MKPHVIIYNQVSLDGRVTGFAPDMDLYYGLISTWQENATLIGCNTILAANASNPEELANDTADNLQPADPDDSRPLLAVIDSRGRVPNWPAWRKLPFIRGLVVLCSRATSRPYLERLAAQKIETIVTGEDHIELPAALDELNTRYGVQVVRVDSGGILNGLLLQAGLVDEVSLLLTPCIAGDQTTPFIHTPDGASLFPAINLRLFHSQPVGEGLLWLRYKVLKG